MAIGNYRLARETYRGIPVGSGRGTVRGPQAPDVAGVFGRTFATTVQAGIDWYQHVVDVGRLMQGKAAQADKKAERDAAEAAELRKRQAAAENAAADDFDAGSGFEDAIS